MAKRPQSGDIDIHFDRIFTATCEVLGSHWPIFDAQGGPGYRNWPNGRRVATSTSTLTAKNAWIRCRRPIFDAQGGPGYRNWPNGRRVATSTSRLTAYLRIVLHGRIRVISNRGKGESPQPRQPDPGGGRGGQRRPGRQRRQRRPERQTGKRRQQETGKHVIYHAFPRFGVAGGKPPSRATSQTQGEQRGPERRWRWKHQA